MATPNLEQIIQDGFDRFLKEFQALIAKQPSSSKVGSTQNNSGAEMKQALDKLGQVLGQIPILGGVIASSFNAITTILSKFGAFNQARKNTNNPGAGGVPTAQQNLIVALNNLTNAIYRLINDIRARTGQRQLAQPVNQPTPNPSQSNPAASAVASIAPELAAVGVVAGAIVGVLQQLFSLIQKSVGALNPGLIDLFNIAMDNLYATIGSAFLPVIQDLISVLRQAAGIIKPAMEALAPIVKEVADYFANWLIKYIQIVVENFKALIPIFQILFQILQPVFEIFLLLANVASILFRVIADVIMVFWKLSGLSFLFDALTGALKILNIGFQVITEAMNIFQVVLDFVIEAFTSLFAGMNPLKDMLKLFKDAIQQVIRWMYLLAISIANTIPGFGGLADAIIRSIEKKLAVGNVANKGEASIVGFEEIIKQASTGAQKAAAGGGDGVDDERKFWQQLLDEARQARESRVAEKEKDRSILRDIIVGAISPLALALDKLVGNTIRKPSPPNVKTDSFGGGGLAGLIKRGHDFIKY